MFTYAGRDSAEFTTTWFDDWFHGGLQHHIEHHLYPQVPFYSLPGLHDAIRDQLPEPSTVSAASARV